MKGALDERDDAALIARLSDMGIQCCDLAAARIAALTENKRHMTRLWQAQVCARTKSEIRRVDAERRAEAAEAECDALRAKVARMEGAGETVIAKWQSTFTAGTTDEEIRAQTFELDKAIMSLRAALTDVGKDVIRDETA